MPSVQRLTPPLFPPLAQLREQSRLRGGEGLQCITRPLYSIHPWTCVQRISLGGRLMRARTMRTQTCVLCLGAVQVEDRMASLSHVLSVAESCDDDVLVHLGGWVGA